jgi:hypothetical protein
MLLCTTKPLMINSWKKWMDFVRIKLHSNENIKWHLHASWRIEFTNLIEEKWMQIGVKDIWKYIHDYGVEIIMFLKRQRCEKQHVIRREKKRESEKLWWLSFAGKCFLWRYVAVEQIKDKLVKNNKKTYWVPDSVKVCCFGSLTYMKHYYRNFWFLGRIGIYVFMSLSFELDYWFYLLTGAWSEEESDQVLFVILSENPNSWFILLKRNLPLIHA